MGWRVVDHVTIYRETGWYAGRPAAHSGVCRSGLVTLPDGVCGIEGTVIEET